MATRRNQSLTIVKAVVFAGLAFVLPLDVAKAADMTTDTRAAGTPPPSDPHWFVRIGPVGAFNQSSTKLYVQTIVGSFGVGPQLLVPNRGESFSNLFTVVFQAGYFVTPNWSLEVAGGVPVWQTTRITGISAAAPYAGTVLTETLPGSVPITAVYHVSQLGPLQPYAGAGIAPVFAFEDRDAFAIGNTTEPSLAPVLQGGFDYMLNQSWGVFFDAKKFFDRSVGKATGLNFGPAVGVIHVAATSVTNSQPWVLSTGLTYRF